jgi:hydroxymethylbilane synthase
MDLAMKAIRLGTRGSQLALWQANHVRDLLSPHTDAPIELVVIETHGDADQQNRLAAMGGFGVFTKAIQDALLVDRCDIAVHSLKDLPTPPVFGLILAGVPKRGPVGDAFLSQKYSRFNDLPQGAIVGTSSLRRRAQILHQRPDLQLVDLRGNIDTRLRKLREQNLDAIVLAQAGLDRLGLGGEITERLNEPWMLPSVGQGAIGLECRTEDQAIRDLLQKITHLDTFRSVRAERMMLLALGGGCLIPIGASSRMEGDQLHLTGAVYSPDGKEKAELTWSGSATQEAGEAIGRIVAQKLLERGADRLLMMK